MQQIPIQPSAVQWESPIEALSEMEKDQKKLFYGDTKHTNLESLNNSIASIFSSQNYHKRFCILYFWADQNGEKTLSNIPKGESAHNLALSHDFAFLL